MPEQKPRPKSSEFKGQKLPYPAKQSEMVPQPDSDLSNYKAAGKLENKTAIITGADSGIGRAVAIAFAMEGANVAIVYNVNDNDAETTRKMVEEKGRLNDSDSYRNGQGRQCLVIKADVRDSKACYEVIEK